MEKMVDINLTPKELAKEFYDMFADQQVEFFNECAELIQEGKTPFCFQLQFLVNDVRLSPHARQLMRQFGEYAEQEKAAQP